MGRGVSQLNGPEIFNAGWFTDEQVITLTKNGENELFLAALNYFPGQTFSTPVKLARLPVSKNKGKFYEKYDEIYYTVEFRQYGNMNDGEIFISASRLNSRTLPPLLKSNLIAPPGPYALSKVPTLKVVETFRDKQNGYRVKFDSVSAGVAKVIITKETPPSLSTPSKAPILTPNSGNLGPSPSQASSNVNQWGAQFLTYGTKNSVPYSWAFIDNRITVSMTIKNTGQETWTRANGVILMWYGQPGNNPWGTPNFFMLDESDSIAPGQEKVFSFIITKPTSGANRIGPCGGGYVTGEFSFGWRMYNTNNNVGFFGQSFRRDICV